MAYIDQYKLASNVIFKARVTTAACVAAKQILAEKGINSKRKEYVQYVVSNPERAGAVIALVVAGNYTLSEQSTDDEILKAIKECWPMFSGE